MLYSINHFFLPKSLELDPSFSSLSDETTLWLRLHITLAVGGMLSADDTTR